jgi:ferritin
MNIGTKMETAINKQIGEEFYSAYLYLSMAGYFESKNLKGFANWMKVQYQEEISHAMKLFDYVHERGGSIDLKAIEKPPSKWKSPLAAIQAAYEHEKKITKMIDKLYTLASREKDTATQVMLQWFVTEQVEEESSVGAVMEELKLVGNSGNGLFLIDKELGKRKSAE